jgi:4-diphosphocytidyl-2-C-methyl-D-erythritol kinase
MADTSPERLCPGTDYITAKSHAKINLTLDILKKVRTLHGEYHLVNTILHEIPLHDEITFTKTPERKITIECNDPAVPTDKSNIIHAALHQLPNLKTGLHIKITKNIPVASGLGGGSSNAATTLKAVSELCELNITHEKLLQCATKIGTDVPFFLRGGTAHGTHFGEKVEELDIIELPPLLIVLNDSKTSTKDIYQALDLTQIGKQTQATEGFINDPTQFDLLHNDFEKALPAYQNHALQKKLLQLGADVVHICGSGPALYALFSDKQTLLTAYNELKGKVRFVWNSA